MCGSVPESLTSPSRIGNTCPADTPTLSESPSREPWTCLRGAPRQGPPVRDTDPSNAEIDLSYPAHPIKGFRYRTEDLGKSHEYLRDSRECLGGGRAPRRRSRDHLKDADRRRATKTFFARSALTVAVFILTFPCVIRIKFPLFKPGTSMSGGKPIGWVGMSFCSHRLPI